jgi:succinoglycan biosynthesis transport protein ExoP
VLERIETPEINPNITPGGPPPALDPIRVAWRWKWLILLGAGVGCGLGYLNWTKQPTVYIASARLQVTMPLPIGIDELDLDRVAKLSSNRNRTDEAIVISSAPVLREAITNAELGSFEELAGMDSNSIIRWIQGGLKIEPASKDLQTTIINMSFTSGNPKLSEAVISGVIAGYNDFLGAEYRKTGTEIVNQINKVREEIDSRFTKLSNEYAVFRNEAPLYWIGGEGRDPFADNLIATLQELERLDLQITKIRGTIVAAETALTAERPLEGIYLMLASEIGGIIGSTPVSQKSSAEARLENQQNSGQAKIDQLRENLLTLQIRERSLTEAGYGENHPNMLALRRELQAAEIMISKLDESIRARNAEALAHLDSEKENATPNDFQISSPKERVIAMINGLKEKLVGLETQKTQLEEFQQENEAKSRELQGYVTKNKLFLDQIKSSQEVITAISTTLDKMSVAPDSGNRTMQELDRFGASPSRATMIQFVGLGGSLGGLLFAVLGYLLSFADRRYKGPEDVIRELGRPILGQIPLMDTRSIERKDSKIDASIVVHHRSKSTMSESFRGVRTSLYFGNQAGDLKIIQVTSASPADGKSTLAANLAVSIAQSGRKIALVDCDFRRPRVDKIFGAENKIGLSTMLAGDAELPDILQTSEVPNLTLITSGTRPSNPAELLSSEQYTQALAMLREKFDYVIIDSPPILAVSDPAAIAARVDGTLLALRLRHNDRALSTRALKMLSSINANVLGVVVVGVTGNGSTYGRGYGYGSYGNYGSYGQGYGYGYGYGYGQYGKNPYKSYYDIPDADDKKKRLVKK